MPEVADFLKIYRDAIERTRADIMDEVQAGMDEDGHDIDVGNDFMADNFPEIWVFTPEAYNTDDAIINGNVTSDPCNVANLFMLLRMRGGDQLNECLYAMMDESGYGKYYDNWYLLNKLGMDAHVMARQQYDHKI